MNDIWYTWGRLCTQLKGSLCVCACVQPHGVRLYCADHWCLLSVTERETTPFVREKSTERVNLNIYIEMMSQKRRIFSPFECNKSKTSMYTPFEMNDWKNECASEWKICLDEGVLVCEETQCMCKSAWIQGCNLYWLTDLLQENATQLQLLMLAIYTQLSHSITA